MAFAQRTLSGQAARRGAWRSGTRIPGAIAAGAVSALARLAFGPGEGYRDYPRQRLPEIEVHELLAGRRDRFDAVP
jgi:hypothetical protein